jgi:hypothetical protein
VKEAFSHNSKNVWGIKVKLGRVMQRNFSTLINVNAPLEVIRRNAKAWDAFCKNEKGDSAAYPETGVSKSSPYVDTKICRPAPSCGNAALWACTCIHPMKTIGKHVYGKR